jgi:hypothetical protein
MPVYLPPIDRGIRISPSFDLLKSHSSSHSPEHHAVKGLAIDGPNLWQD